jgi:hypothetical protein
VGAFFGKTEPKSPAVPKIGGEFETMQELLLDSLVQAIAETVMAEISFPHFDAGRLAGYELKKGVFTRFATEGTKELWVSNIRIDDDCINCINCIVFGESAIDALSHAALFRNENICYASIGASRGAATDLFHLSPAERSSNRAGRRIPAEHGSATGWSADLSENW